MLGAAVNVFDQQEDWSWVQICQDDGYVGYMPTTALGAYEGELRDGFVAGEPTHYVSSTRSFVYPGPDIKYPASTFVSLGAGLILGEEVQTRDVRYRKLLNLITPNGEPGWVVTQHIRKIDDLSNDFVSVAESLMGTPYLWGGRSSLGIDCSGLVQLCCQLAGIRTRRDASMQEEDAGISLGYDGNLPSLHRGDLLFWDGHVGIMQNNEMLLHANGHHMCVATEHIEEALIRIEAKPYGKLRTIRRFISLHGDQVQD